MLKIMVGKDKFYCIIIVSKILKGLNLYSKTCNALNIHVILSPPNVLSSARFLFCFNIYSASKSLIIGETVV